MAKRFAVGYFHSSRLKHGTAAQFYSARLQMPLGMMNFTEDDAIGLERAKETISFCKPVIQCSWRSQIGRSCRSVGSIEFRGCGFVLIAHALVFNEFAR